MRDNLTALRRHHIEPVGVNPGSAESHEEFRKEIELPFPLLVDEGMDVARAYGALRPDESGIARSVVIVGRDGNVIFAEPGAPTHSRMINAIRDASDLDAS